MSLEDEPVPEALADVVPFPRVHPLVQEREVGVIIQGAHKDERIGIRSVQGIDALGMYLIQSFI